MQSQLLGPVIVALATILGLFLSVYKLKRGFKDELESETSKAIQNAKDMAESDVKLLKLQIDNLSKEINRLDESFQKDVAHIRETYNSEIRNLGVKIEDLREEVRTQHSQLVTLLTKLVSER